VFSPDRIPDFATLPGPDQVWPDAVHRLPAKLPSGDRYSVVAVLGDDRYLVTRGAFENEAGPSIFNTRTGTVTELATPKVTEGLAMSTVLMAKEINGKAVWFLEGSRNNHIGREAWMAPLNGGPATRLTDLPDATAPRFSPAGNAIIWEYEIPGTWKNPKGPTVFIRTISLNGGPVVNVPDTTGFELANVGPWITNQRSASDLGTKTSGVLRNVTTGQRLRWKAAPGIQYLRCGPTWCTGVATGNRIALQSLDGTDPITLPVEGSLSPTGNGRLAVGSIERPDTTAQVVWDRTTGRAAIMLPRRVPDPLSSATQQTPVLDNEPDVLTVSATDNELVVLDLRAIG
jgi:hypothetical protein